MKIVNMQIEDESKATYYGWLIVGMTFLATLTAFGLAFSFGLFLKPVSADLGWSRTATAGIFSAYAISHNLFAPITGKICDRFAPKIMAGTAGICLASAMILMRYVSSIWMAYSLFAVIFGFGVAASYVPMMASASRWFTMKRGLAIGCASTGLGAGILCASPLGAWLVSSYGWRVAYAVAGCAALVIFIPVTVFITGAPRKIDKEGKVHPLVGFTFFEALSTGVLWIYGFCWFFITAGLVTIIVHLPSLLTDRGVSLIQAGFLLGVIGASSIAGKIIGGYYSDRRGRKLILISGYFIQGIMLVWLYFSNEILMLWIFCVFFGLGYGLWAGVIASFPADYFGSKATGTIFGFVMILSGLGGAIGPFIGGYIYDTSSSYQLTILLCIIATISAIISSWFLNPPKEKTLKY